MMLFLLNVQLRNKYDDDDEEFPTMDLKKFNVCLCPKPLVSCVSPVNNMEKKNKKKLK